MKLQIILITLVAFFLTTLNTMANENEKKVYINYNLISDIIVQDYEHSESFCLYCNMEDKLNNIDKFFRTKVDHMFEIKPSELFKQNIEKKRKENPYKRHLYSKHFFEEMKDTITFCINYEEEKYGRDNFANKYFELYNKKVPFWVIKKRQYFKRL
jgi:hypothetical protein